MSFSGFGIQYSSRCDEKILLVACSRNSGDFGMEVVGREDYIGCGEDGS